MTNWAVDLVVAALWTIACVLVPAGVGYSHRAVVGADVAIASTAATVSPSLMRIQVWLAHRLSSPPETPRLETA